MNKSSLPSITKILIFTALGAIGALFAFRFLMSSPVGQSERAQTQLFSEVILSAIPSIQEKWTDGITEKNQRETEKCVMSYGKGKHYSAAFSKCNPQLMECLLKREIPLTYLDKTYHVRGRASFDAISGFSDEKRFTQVIARSTENRPHLPVLGLMIDLEVKELPGMSWKMILENTCQDTYLPERFYSYGKKNDPWEMEWDNVGRNIYIDKFLVSRLDINWWVSTEKKSEKYFTQNPEEWPLPALTLNLTEQEEYCAWLGKRRMEAHLYDAATFMPGSLNQPFPDFIFKTWSYWERDKSKTFFLSKDKLKEGDCTRAWVKGCAEKFPFRPFDTNSATWMGIYQTSGGEMEALKNTIDHTQTLELSSYYLERNSEFHQLGSRGEWNGEGMDRDDFRLPANVIIPKGVGFRCYREI